MDGGGSSPMRARQSVLSGLGQQVEPRAGVPHTREDWLDILRPVLADLSHASLSIAEAAVRALPADFALLLVAAVAALVAGQPDRAISFIKRFERKCERDPAVTLLTGLALAQQGHMARAWSLLDEDQLLNPYRAIHWFVGGQTLKEWLFERLDAIRSFHQRQERETARLARQKAASKTAVRPAPGPARTKTKLIAAKPSPAIADLPRLDVALSLSFDISAATETIQLTGTAPDPIWFGLRQELTQLGLIEGFDELLCLASLQGVEAHWYQIETVRKVLKQYRGRVLLADEVGLGKTDRGRHGAERIHAARHGRARPNLGTSAAWSGSGTTNWPRSSVSTAPPPTITLLRSDPEAFWAQKLGDRLDRHRSPSGTRRHIGCAAPMTSWWSTRRIISATKPVPATDW